MYLPYGLETQKTAASWRRTIIASQYRII